MMMLKSYGFTLLEMMIVIAILGAVIIAIPALDAWMGRQGVSLAAQQVRCDLQLARMMAIKHRGPCAIVVLAPGQNSYQNSLTRQLMSLSQFRGGVHFLNQGPDGITAAPEIVFNRRGMSTSAVPRDLFLADAELNRIYRIRVRLPGNISVHCWGRDRWY